MLDWAAWTLTHKSGGAELAVWVGDAEDPADVVSVGEGLGAGSAWH